VCIGGPNDREFCGLKDSPSNFCNLVCNAESSNPGASCVNDKNGNTETDDCGYELGDESACDAQAAGGPYACEVPFYCAEGSTNEGDHCVNDLNGNTETDDCGGAPGDELACELVLGGTDLLAECCNDTGSICARAEETGNEPSKKDITYCLGRVTAFNESDDSLDVNLCKELPDQQGNCAGDSGECETAATNGEVNDNPWDAPATTSKSSGK